jgi:hypothetical protein
MSRPFQPLCEIAGGLGKGTVGMEGLQGAKWWLTRRHSHVAEPGADDFAADVIVRFSRECTCANGGNQDDEQQSDTDMFEVHEFSPLSKVG